MCWICFPIPLVLACMWGTPWDILPVIFFLATNATKDLMCYTLRVMIHLGCLQNNMPYKQGNTRRPLPKKTLPAIVSNWIKWVFLLIGVERFVPQSPIFTNGHNGSFYCCLTIIIATRPTKPSPLQTWCSNLKNREPRIWT